MGLKKKAVTAHIPIKTRNGYCLVEVDADWVTLHSAEPDNEWTRKMPLSLLGRKIWDGRGWDLGALAAFVVSVTPPED